MRYLLALGILVLMSCVPLERSAPKISGTAVAIVPSASPIVVPTQLVPEAIMPTARPNGKMFPNQEMPSYFPWVPPSDKWEKPVQTPNVIKVKVLDLRQQPLSGVQVYEHKQPQTRSMTNSQGETEVFLSSRQDVLDLMARKPGYYPQRFIGFANQPKHQWGQQQQIVFGSVVCNETTFQANPLYTVDEADCCEDIDAWNWNAELRPMLISAHDEDSNALEDVLFYARIHELTFNFVSLNSAVLEGNNPGMLIAQRTLLWRDTYIKAAKASHFSSLNRIALQNLNVGFNNDNLSFGDNKRDNSGDFPDAAPLYKLPINTPSQSNNPFALVAFYDLPVTLLDENKQPVKGALFKLESQSCEYPFKKEVTLSSHQGVISQLPVGILLRLSVQIGTQLFSSQLFTNEPSNKPFFISQPKKGVFSPSSLSLTLTKKGTVNIIWKSE